jgi:hypothetical protein
MEYNAKRVFEEFGINIYIKNERNVFNDENYFTVCFGMRAVLIAKYTIHVLSFSLNKYIVHSIFPNIEINPPLYEGNSLSNALEIIGIHFAETFKQEQEISLKSGESIRYTTEYTSAECSL